MPRCSATVLTALLVAVGVRSTHAEPERADPRITEAEKSFAKREFVQASAMFRTLYEDTEETHFLYAWAQSTRFAGNCEKAVELYRQYIDTEPPEQNVLAAEANIDECKNLLGDSPRGTSGPTTIVYKQTTRETISEVNWYSEPWTIALLGTGTAAIAGGFAASLYGRNLITSSVDEADHGRALRQLNRGRKWEKWGWGGVIAGGALVGIGVARAVWSSPEREEPPISPYVGKDQAGVSFQTTF